MSQVQSTAAFFDVDGTLLPPPSLEWRFVSYLLGRDKLDTANILRWLVNVALSLPRGARRAIEANKSYVAGLPVSLVADWVDSFAEGHSNCGLLGIFQEGLVRVRWHQSLNHRIFLVTGTLAPLAKHFASILPGRAESIATELAVSIRAGAYAPCFAMRTESGAPKISSENPDFPVWTGELAGEHIVGDAKRRAVQSLASRHDLDLTNCYAYGNSWGDRAMLEAVGHPEVINPSRRLTSAARKRGWPISQWASTETSKHKTFARSMILSALPGPPSAEKSRS